MSAMTWEDLAPGDTRAAGWLNDALDALAASSGAIAPEQLRAGGLQRERLAEPAHHKAFDAEARTVEVAAAWPTTWGPLPGALETSSTDSFDIPPWSALLVTASFDFVTTNTDDAVPIAANPDTTTPEWRIHATIDGVDTVDDYSHGWIGQRAQPVGGSAFTEACFVNDSVNAVTVTLVQIQCQEAFGTIIQAGMVRMEGVILGGVR